MLYPNTINNWLMSATNNTQVRTKIDILLLFMLYHVLCVIFLTYGQRAAEDVGPYMAPLDNFTNA